MKHKFLFLIGMIPILLIHSCQSIPKKIAYFEDIDAATLRKIIATNQLYREPTIKNNDMLTITVTSPIKDQDIVAQFNLPMTSYLSPGEKVLTTSASLQTYLVDKEGCIDFPVIGRVQLGGLLLGEARNHLSEKIQKHIVNPIVNIEIISFKVTVMGEVLKPGEVEVKNGRISVLDAIGAVGDMTIYGRRDNVKIIRDINGEIEIAQIDLSSSDIITSPYFYLQQNDVVYVEPNETRMRESRYGEYRTYSVTIISTVIGAVSMLATLIIAFSKI